jgi:2-isopropylmalate synthase
MFEKLEFAKQLKRLKVDFIEAGFPMSSPGDLKAVAEVAKAVGDDDIVITALARAVKSDIDAVYEGVKHAKRPLIHIVLGTSDIHVEKKFHKTKEQVLEQGVESVKYAKTLLPDVQYSTEDASRSDFEYMWKTIEAVVKAGATIINVPDTVGYAVPEEFGEIIRKINYRLKNLNDKVLLSVHCHNDTGLATANTLIAVKNGADKVECTINGIGERAGNAALEEVVMGIKVRSDYYNAFTNVDTKEIKRTSNLATALMGLEVQVNKAITGGNAFAHSSGIHQDGLLKARDSYEIINPDDVGVDGMELILTARSGRHAFKNALSNLGYNNFSETEFESIFAMFLELADTKKEVYDADLFYLIEKFNSQYGKELDENGKKITESIFTLDSAQVISNDIFPSASVKLKKGNEILKTSSVGDGPIDALYTAIKDLVGMNIELKEYKTSSITKGKEALGKVNIRLQYKDKIYSANATDTDIIKASGYAYLNGVNKIIIEDVLGHS